MEMSLLTDRGIPVSINSPPELIFVMKSVKLQLLVSQMALMKETFL
jgi:hypothetical protein